MAVTVEACLAFDTRDLQRHGEFAHPSQSGTITWTLASETLFVASYALEGIETAVPVLRLRYTARGEDGTTALVRSVFPMCFTVLGGGGVCWWFKCPGCDHTVRKVYLRPGSVDFRCRSCHRLSYQSKLLSHTLEGDLYRLVRYLKLVRAKSQYRALGTTLTSRQLSESGRPQVILSSVYR
jgi:hypothetical protein